MEGAQESLFSETGRNQTLQDERERVRVKIFIRESETERDTERQTDRQTCRNNRDAQGETYSAIARQ